MQARGKETETRENGQDIRPSSPPRTRQLTPAPHHAEKTKFSAIVGKITCEGGIVNEKESMSFE